MPSKKVDSLIKQALAIEEQQAVDAQAVGYMARAMVLASLPHRQVQGSYFQRVNGNFTLTLMAPPDIGMPYGTIPRLLLAWLTSEAVRTKSRHLELGDTLSSFMVQLGLPRTGGRNGGITRLKDQTERLFSATVSAVYADPALGRKSIKNVSVASEASLWWDAKLPDQVTLWGSVVSLTAEFYEEVISSPVPLDLRALQALRQSPLALDIYAWLTHRMAYLKKPSTIPWAALECQFGCDYAETRFFKREFINRLKGVSVVYPEARIEVSDAGLILKPSKPHVPKLSGG